MTWGFTYKRLGSIWDETKIRVTLLPVLPSKQRLGGEVSVAVIKAGRAMSQQRRRAFPEAMAPPADRAGSSPGSPSQGAESSPGIVPFLPCPFGHTGHNCPLFYSFLDNTLPCFCSSHSGVSQAFPPGARSSPSCSCTLGSRFFPPAPFAPCTAPPGGWRWGKPQNTGTLGFPEIHTPQGLERFRTFPFRETSLS